MPDPRWLIYLLVAAAWTTFFSMFNAPGIRGWRNLGLLAMYVTGIVMFFKIPFLSAAGTWAVLGLASGLLYFLWETWGYLKTRDAEAAPRLRTIAHGLTFWPIMLPEVIEYTLAEIGVLKASRPVERAPAEQEWSQMLFSQGELAFASLPHVIAMSSSEAILAHWAGLVAAPLGIWGVMAPYSKTAGDEPDYEDPPFGEWASEKNQRELYGWLAQHVHGNECLIIDGRLDEEFVRGALSNNLPELEIAEKWRKITHLIVTAQTWLVAPLSPHGDFLLFIGSEPWRQHIREMAAWCEETGIKLNFICDGPQPKLLPCCAADVGLGSAEAS